MIRFNLHWQNGYGISVEEHLGQAGSGSSGQIKQAEFWERKYRVTDQTGTHYWLNRGSLIERINSSQFSKTPLIKGHSWDYLGWFGGATDEEIKTHLESILLQEAKEAPITAQPKETIRLILTYITCAKIMGRMSQLSHAWQHLVHASGWPRLASQLTICCSRPWERIQACILEGFETCFYTEKTDKFLEIAALNQLQEECEARNAIRVWDRLQSAIKESFFLNPQNYEDYIAKRGGFSEWCKTHQVKLQQKVHTLNLGSRLLIILPPEIGMLTWLQELDLSQSSLTELPPQLGNLSQLKVLNLESNKLTCLPPELGNLSQLQKLDLNRNKLTTLPAEIGKLSELKILEVHWNKLSSIPDEVGNLLQLRKLGLFSNNLTKIPALGNLSQLQELILSVNQLTEMPELGKLSQLQELDLGKNELTSPPAGIGKLLQLKKLDLSRNRFTSLPSELRNLHQLEKVELTMNPWSQWTRWRWKKWVEIHNSNF